LVAVFLLASCGNSGPGMPKLPETATPGWTRKSLVKGPSPAGLDAAKAECWKAEYTSKGEAQVWACGFSSEGSAFEAVQKSRSEANTVRFQARRFYVVVQWNGVSRDEITALVRAVQRDLAAK
jgi:hypothetical protein